MTNLVAKPTELLTAQATAFIAEGVGDHSEKQLLYKELGGAVMGSTQESYTGDYANFLRGVSGSNDPGIIARAEMIKGYRDFKPDVSLLKNELAGKDAMDRRSHPAYLGHGSTATAFIVEREGRDYVVRIPDDSEEAVHNADSQVTAAILGRGVPHLGQIVAVSYEDGVTVAERLPGKEIGNLTFSEIQRVTDMQLGDLVATLANANSRGIYIDPNPSNYLYDLSSGFGILDYGSYKEAGNGFERQDVGTIVGNAAMAIANMGLWDKALPETAEDYERDREIRNENLTVLHRYRNQVAEKLTGGDLEKASQIIDGRIRRLEEVVGKELAVQ